MAEKNYDFRKRLAILHQCFDSVGVECTSKALIGTLHALDYRQGHILLGKLAVEVDHLLGLVLGLLTGGMSSVTLLPKELGSAEKQAGTHLPTHHIGPLVAQDGQVAV